MKQEQDGELYKTPKLLETFTYKLLETFAYKFTDMNNAEGHPGRLFIRN